MKAEHKSYKLLIKRNRSPQFARSFRSFDLKDIEEASDLEDLIDRFINVYELH